MARIVGVDLPKNKRGEIALTYIYGVGRSSAQKVLTEAKVDWDKKVSEWNDDEINKIRQILNENYTLEGYRFISRYSSQNWIACQRSEHKKQRSYP